jgi:hypothetical protein
VQQSGMDFDGIGAFTTEKLANYALLCRRVHDRAHVSSRLFQINGCFPEIHAGFDESGNGAQLRMNPNSSLHRRRTNRERECGEYGYFSHTRSSNPALLS